MLAGGYLNYERRIDSVIFMFSRLVKVRGIVHPVVDGDLHLAAELSDGELVMGQHRLTGKEVEPIRSPVERVFVVDDLERQEPREPSIDDLVRGWIESADLITYPMGSFYTSVVASLLPHGVGDALVANRAPKIYVPNTGVDPEQCGMTVADSVERLLAYATASCSEDPDPARLLDFVLVDSQGGDYGGRLDLDRIRDLGIRILDVPLTGDRNGSDLDPDRVLEVLVSLS